MTRYRLLFLLLLVALILASAAIAWTGYDAVLEERDTDADLEMRATRSQIGRDLLALLTDIKLGEMTREPWNADGYADPAVALVGWVQGDSLVFAWSTVSLDERAKAFKRSIDAADFAAMRVEADRAAFRKDYDREIEIYLTMSASSDRNQREFARLLWAGALMRSGRSSEGIALYRSLLNLPSDLVDESGCPLALYSKDYVANALLSLHAPELDRDVLDRANREISSFAGLSRSENFLGPILKELQKSTDAGVRTDAGSALERLSERTAQLERMRAMPEARDLQEAFASRTIVPAVWAARTFPPAETWLVGMTEVRSGPSLVIAVRADDIRKRIENGQSLRFAGCPSAELQSLGPSLPGSCVLPFAAPVKSPAIGLPLLFALALVFVGILGPACLWLLWRDTRREIHLAELRSQFVSSVSHELKTPLTAIRMFAETLQVRAADGPKHTQYLEIIVSESERLTRLLNNVLDFSRMERGERQYQMQVAPLGDVVQSVARTMRFPLTAQGFDFRVEVSDAVPPTPIDRDAIEQAVLNLLSNAMKFSGEKRDIALSLRRQNGSALIQVTDCGIGIPAEEQERIFEKFYRVQIPENQAISGAGLGLALVSHIAAAHGGSVEVESAIGRGSTFSIRLPMPPADNDD